MSSTNAIMHKNLFFPDATPASYTGSCHCKAIRFRATMPALDENAVSSCNCSACTTWGLMNMMVWRDDLEIEGEDQLKEYQFGQKRMVHKFCPTCSTNLFVYLGTMHILATPRLGRLNVGMLSCLLTTVANHLRSETLTGLISIISS